MIYKYFCMLIYLAGLVFIAFYQNVCEMNDLFYSYVSKKIYKSYDYIVVGAGSAGSVVALRLSQDPDSSVLLLEAGGYGGKLLDIPVLGPILHSSIYDWQYSTVPQENACKAFKNNVSYWPMGKIIGGTGRLNNMVYTRGHENDFNEWFKDLPDYNYEQDVLAYFKKAENQIERYINDTKYHATDGPLIVNGLPFVTKMYEAVAKAAELLGFPIRDLNGKFNSGFSQPQANIKNGARYSTGHHLLLNRRPNLTVKTHSIVEKILFKSNFEAYAVKFASLGDSFVVKARHAVILSAGVIGSPKILMLSGIGPKKHLHDTGIKPKLDLPVGENLQDHIATGFDLVTLRRPLSFNLYSLASPFSFFEYFFKSSGPMTSIGCEAVALLNTNCLSSGSMYDSCENGTTPNLELMFMPVGLTSDYGLRFKNVVGISDAIWDDYFTRLYDENAFNVLGVVLHPKSRGTIRLKDKNPQSKPIIDPKYLSDPDDADVLIRGIDFIKTFVKTKPFVDLGARFNEAVFPGCTSYEFDSRDYWRCYVKFMTFTLYHPGGTCKMGNDGVSVVGYDFKVVGTNKLYVADGSVMPSLPSANTNAAIVMIAEKAASVLKYHRFLMDNVCNLIEIFIPKLFC